MFEDAASEVVAEGGDIAFPRAGHVYPDVVESGGGTGTANIKSHHNVGAARGPRVRTGRAAADLFKDEVRAVGTALGLPDDMVWRHPFPGPGLAIRIVGEVTQENLETLRRADAIACAELTAAGLDRSVWQFPRGAAGRRAQCRRAGRRAYLRTSGGSSAGEVRTPATADWSRLPHEVIATISTRITNEGVRGEPVVLDVTSKPQAPSSGSDADQNWLGNRPHPHFSTSNTL